MRLAGFTASALMVGALAFGCSSSSESEKLGQSTANIQGGESDTTNKFAVGIKSSSGGLCSGALILPNLVATARHCVSASPERIDCSENPEFGANRTGFSITTNATIEGSTTGPGWYKAKTVYRPNDAHICGNDIALIVLDKSVPASEAKPIIPGVQHVMWDNARFVPSFTAIGYGRTSPGSVGNGEAGLRRILADIPVRCVPGSPTMDCPSSFNAKEFFGGSGICKGDSGSSAYETSSFQAGEPVSFGVLSRGGTSADGTSCESSVYTRFDAHRDFILDVAKVASANWTLYPEPAWTAYVEPPAGSTKADAGANGSTEGDDDGYALIGEECSRNRDCVSKLCVEVDGAKVCTKSCDADAENACGKGFECREAVCLKQAQEPATAPSAAAPPPATQTITTTGCSFSTDAPRASSASWLAGLGLALAAVRRRKR